MDSENMCVWIFEYIELLESGKNTDLKCDTPVWDIEFILSKYDVR